MSRIVFPGGGRAPDQLMDAGSVRDRCVTRILVKCPPYGRRCK